MGKKVLIDLAVVSTDKSAFNKIQKEFKMEVTEQFRGLHISEAQIIFFVKKIVQIAFSNGVLLNTEKTA